MKTLTEIFKRPIVDKVGYRVSYKDVLFGAASGKSYYSYIGGSRPQRYKRVLAFRDDARTECFLFPNGIISHSDFDGHTGSISELDAFFNGKMILRNADVGEGPVSFLNFDGPCFSFSCLARFFGLDVNSKKGVSPFLKLLDFVEIVDFTKDQISETAKPGFTRVGRKYHKAGSVLIKVPERWSATGNRPLNVDGYYLLGFDDGQYFGCELPHKVDSMKAAYESLIPDGARGKKGVKRQGEWFFVPVKDKDVPSGAVLKFFVSPNYSFTLPQDDKDSNTHDCWGNKNCWGNKKGEIRIDMDEGDIYMRDVHVVHEQHSPVVISDWHLVYKNLALRSFSVDGVD